MTAKLHQRWVKVILTSVCITFFGKINLTARTHFTVTVESPRGFAMGFLLMSRANSPPESIVRCTLHSGISNLPLFDPSSASPPPHSVLLLPSSKQAGGGPGLIVPQTWTKCRRGGAELWSGSAVFLPMGTHSACSFTSTPPMMSNVRRGGAAELALGGRGRLTFGTGAEFLNSLTGLVRMLRRNSNTH